LQGAGNNVLRVVSGKGCAVRRVCHEEPSMLELKEAGIAPSL
jgi:hypothetical protein